MERQIDKTEIFDGKSCNDGPPLHYGHWSMTSVVIPPEFTNALLNQWICNKLITPLSFFQYGKISSIIGFNFFIFVIEGYDKRTRCD